MMRRLSAAVCRGWLACALVSCVLLAYASPVGAQQTSRSRASRSHGAANAKPAKRPHRRAARARAAAANSAPATAAPAPEKPSAADKAAPASSGRTETSAPSVGTPGPAADSSASSDSQGEVRTEGDTQVKVMEFSGLDIEGQLKTPQMLYFLNRLRAEFGHPRLPHRSFMPELQRSTRRRRRSDARARDRRRCAVARGADLERCRVRRAPVERHRPKSCSAKARARCFRCPRARVTRSASRCSRPMAEATVCSPSRAWAAMSRWAGRQHTAQGLREAACAARRRLRPGHLRKHDRVLPAGAPGAGAGAA